MKNPATKIRRNTVNIAALITELRAQRSGLRSETLEFVESPGRWSECHNTAYEKDMAKLEELTSGIDQAVDTLLDMSGCGASSSRIKELRAERKKLDGALTQFLNDNPGKLTKRQQKKYDDAIEGLQVIDREATRIVDTLIATLPHSG